MKDIIKGKDFHISYVSFGGIDDCFIGDTEDETAIVGKDGFLILNGDFREEYKPLVIKGYVACKKFFKQKVKENPDLKSSWSN